MWTFLQQSSVIAPLPDSDLNVYVGWHWPLCGLWTPDTVRTYSDLCRHSSNTFSWLGGHSSATRSSHHSDVLSACRTTYSLHMPYGTTMWHLKATHTIQNMVRPFLNMFYTWAKWERNPVVSLVWGWWDICVVLFGKGRVMGRRQNGITLAWKEPARHGNDCPNWFVTMRLQSAPHDLLDKQYPVKVTHINLKVIYRSLEVISAYIPSPVTLNLASPYFLHEVYVD